MCNSGPWGKKNPLTVCDDCLEHLELMDISAWNESLSLKTSHCDELETTETQQVMAASLQLKV